MKLKVAIVSEDAHYLNRLLKNFQLKYADNVNMYIFSDKDAFYKSLKEVYVDVVLIENSLLENADSIPKGTAVGYLCDRPDVDEIDGAPAICKFQKASDMYKLMLGLYAEKSSNIKMKKRGSVVQVTMFMSAQGGSGTSTAAAAYALRHAANGKKMFYLNLEKFGQTDWYFSGDGVLSLSDVIYSLKSKKSNLIIKLESSIRTDKSGVDYFAPCKNAYDMQELKDEEIGTLIQGLSQVKAYDEIVIDLSGDLTERMQMLMREYADTIIYVCDGSMVGNGKFQNFCQVVRIMEQRQGENLLGKITLLYNRFSSKGSKQMQQMPVTVAGGIHRFEGISGRELAEQVAQTEAMLKL